MGGHRKKSAPVDDDSFATVKLECERSLTALQRGNHTKALRLIKDLSARHKNSAHTSIVHRVQATVYVKVASLINDHNARLRHLKHAADSAIIAVELSPNSIEFSYFYANLLYEIANDANEYDEVIQECERALAVENPIDRGKESFEEENEEKLSTAETRISNVQNDLRSLIDESIWMKSIGNAEEKYRLIIPVTKQVDDPPVEEKRPNEIKKATKTPEERRKEIEVKVEAARLLQQQQKSEAASASPLQQQKSEAASTSPLKQQKSEAVGERNKQRGKGKAFFISDLVRAFWNSMTIDSKKQLFRISVSDLTEYFGVWKDILNTDSEILSEALAFAEANKTWRYWVCFKCPQKFPDFESNLQHVLQEHIRNLIPKLQTVLPQKVDDEWKKMLLNSSWDPLDVSAAVKMIVKESDGNQGSVACPLEDKWPILDDAERASLLERIRDTFALLLRHNYLASGHVNKVIQFAMDELQRMVSGSHLLNYGVDQSPMCIRFLGATQLRKILELLQKICHSCDLARDSETTAPIDDVNVATKVVEIKEKVTLSEDASRLFLDEQILLDAAIEDATQGNAKGSNKDTDPVLSWIFDGTYIPKEDKTQQGLEILEMLEKDFAHLQSLCEKKCESISYEDALQAVEDICLEEGKKRDSSMEFLRRSYQSVLTKRKEEILANESDGSRFDLECKKRETSISDVIKEVEAPNVTSQLCDSESGEHDVPGANDYLNQLDTCIEVGIQKQKEQLSAEVSKIDALIMRHVTGMQKLEAKLESLSARDYLSVLLPLTKSHLRIRLDNLAEKDATEKSDAAREALLAELELESKMGVRGGKDSRHSQEKSKDKKKNKKFRKSKDSKASGGDELHKLTDETSEEISLPVVSDGENLDPEVVSTNSDGLKQEEDQLRQRLEELEAEERKLEETLEYQRHSEEKNKKFWKSKDSKASVGDELHKLTDETSEEISLPVLSDGDNLDSEDKLRQRLEELEAEERKLEEFQRQIRNEAKQKEVIFDDGVPVDSADSISGESDTIISRHLQAQDDYEERFQADLKKAVHQSLDAYEEQSVPLDVNYHGVSPSDVTNEGLYETDVLTGLQNEVGEYNCFLNVIIQSLWHLRRFRDELLRRPKSDHVHVGDPCVVCALYETFFALNIAAFCSRKEPVAPTSLRTALSNLYPDSNYFQKGQMNDASEVLAAIFDCLHRSFTSGSIVCGSDSVDSNRTGSWDCASNACIVHSFFGMDIFERMNCNNCGLVSRYLKYTTFFHNINATALRRMKVMCAESSFDELLNLVEMNHQITCDPEAGGCGKLNYIHHVLSNSPHVFVTVLGWQKTCENTDDIVATLAALNTQIDIRVLYRGLDPKDNHNLVSVVCYCGYHYHCFAYNQHREEWIMYDDKNVKVIGSWADVISMCERGRLQPQVLFFEYKREHSTSYVDKFGI